MAGKSVVYAAESFHKGLLTDMAPWLTVGGATAVKDFFLHEPGRAWKRGGWVRHSLQLGANESVGTVVCIPASTRKVVVAVGGDDNKLYDVTGDSGPQADMVGSDDMFTPRENPPLYAGLRVMCDSAGAESPLTIGWDAGMSQIVVDDLFGGGMPSAQYSLAYLGGLALAGTAVNENRVWFPPDPDLEPDVDIDETWIDTNDRITGLAAAGGALIVFHPEGWERIVGDVPFGRPGANMALQSGGNAGCLDARSIAHIDESVVYAGQEGAWNTTGYTEPVSLTAGRVQRLWRSLFPYQTGFAVVGGLLQRDFYLVSVGEDTLILYVPTGCWTRMEYAANSMAQGVDGNLFLNTYAASAAEGYVHRLDTLLTPGGLPEGTPGQWARDGDGTPVEPTLSVCLGDAGPLKRFAQVRVPQRLAAAARTYADVTFTYNVGADTVRADLTGAVTGEDYTLSANDGGIADSDTMPDFLQVSLAGEGLMAGDRFDVVVTADDGGDPVAVAIFEYGTAAPIDQEATIVRVGRTFTATFPTEDGKTYVMATVDDANGKVCSATVAGDDTDKSLTVTVDDEPTAGTGKPVPQYFYSYVTEVGSYPLGLLGFTLFEPLPSLTASTAAGLSPGSAVLAKTWGPGGRRGSFDAFAGDGACEQTQALTVTVAQTGPSAETEIHGVDVDANVFDQGVTGEND